MSDLGFYTNYFSRGSKLYVRHYKDGIQCDSVFPIKPVLYIKNPKQIRANTGKYLPGKNIHNDDVYPIEFDTPKDAKEFLKSYASSGMEIYGYPRFDYATIDELFPGEINGDFSLVRVAYVDIETEVDSPIYPDETQVRVRRRQ